MNEPVLQTHFDYWLSFPSGSIKVSTNRKNGSVTAFIAAGRERNEQGGLWDRELCRPGSRNGPAELQECHIDFINLSLTHRETNKTSLPKPARFGKDFASKHCLDLVQSS